MYGIWQARTCNTLIIICLDLFLHYFRLQPWKSVTVLFFNWLILLVFLSCRKYSMKIISCWSIYSKIAFLRLYYVACKRKMLESNGSWKSPKWQQTKHAPKTARRSAFEDGKLGVDCLATEIVGKLRCKLRFSVGFLFLWVFVEI